MSASVSSRPSATVSGIWPARAAEVIAACAPRASDVARRRATAAPTATTATATTTRVRMRRWGMGEGSDVRDLEIRPITRDEANAIVWLYHSHHDAVRSHRFAIGAFIGDGVLGCVIVGNPIAQALCDGVTFEVLRLCTWGGRNVASRLLGAAWRASRAMGVRRLVSYLRADERGTSYRAAGWRCVADVKGRAWDTGNKAQRWIPGLYLPTTEIVDRTRWEVGRG